MRKSENQNNDAGATKNGAHPNRVLREIGRLGDELNAIEQHAMTVRADLAALESQLGDFDPATAGVPLLVYTVEQVGEALGLSRSKVYTLISRGELRAIKMDGSRRVRVADLNAYVDQL